MLKELLVSEMIGAGRWSIISSYCDLEHSKYRGWELCEYYSSGRKARTRASHIHVSTLSLACCCCQTSEIYLTWPSMCCLPPPLAKPRESPGNPTEQADICNHPQRFCLLLDVRSELASWWADRLAKQSEDVVLRVGCDLVQRLIEVDIALIDLVSRRSPHLHCWWPERCRDRRNKNENQGTDTPWHNDDLASSRRDGSAECWKIYIQISFPRSNVCTLGYAFRFFNAVFLVDSFVERVILNLTLCVSCVFYLFIISHWYKFSVHTGASDVRMDYFIINIMVPWSRARHNLCLWLCASRTGHQPWTCNR